MTMKSKTIFLTLAFGATAVLATTIFSPPNQTSVTQATPSPAKTQAVETRPEQELGRTEEYDYDIPAPGTYSLPVLKQAGDGTVLGPDGGEMRLQELTRGKITLMSFIYTRCPDPRACPRATGALATVHSISGEDPALAENVRLISMSFDPNFDTREVMNSYGNAWRGDKDGAPWLFLTTPSPEALQPILRDYGQAIEVKKSKDNPYGRIYHNLRVYLIDREGNIRNVYSFGLLDPRLVITDIRTLLMEERNT